MKNRFDTKVRTLKVGMILKSRMNFLRVVTEINGNMAMTMTMESENTEGGIRVPESVECMESDWWEEDSMIWWQKGTSMNAWIGFGVYDSKGREIGTIMECDLKGQIPDFDSEGKPVMIEHSWGAVQAYKTCLTATVLSARAGEEFGSGRTRVQEGGTIEEAKAALILKAMDLMVKAQKKALKNGGIYK